MNTLEICTQFLDTLDSSNSFEPFKISIEQSRTFHPSDHMHVPPLVWSWCMTPESLCPCHYAFICLCLRHERNNSLPVILWITSLYINMVLPLCDPLLMWTVVHLIVRLMPLLMMPLLTCFGYTNTPNCFMQLADSLTHIEDMIDRWVAECMASNKVDWKPWLSRVILNRWGKVMTVMEIWQVWW